jgi:hypothetical protein
MISEKKQDGIVLTRKGISRQNLVNGDRKPHVKLSVKKGTIMPARFNREKQSGYPIRGRIITIDDVDHR